MPITEITKPVARALGAQVEGLLQAFCKQHGLTVAYEGGKFSSDSFTMKVTLRTTTPSASAEGLTPFQFLRAAILLGLPEDCYGKVTMIRGIGYKITGLHLNRPKYPVSVEQLSNGKRFKMQVEPVLSGLLK